MDFKEETIMRKILEQMKEINFHLKAISDSLKDSDKKEGAEKHEA